VGTIGQALRAGVPMLVVPFAHDQPDNAERVRRLGVARVLPRARYNTARAAAALRHLLEDPGYAARAAAVGRRVRSEDGTAVACAPLERLAAARGCRIKWQDGHTRPPEPTTRRRGPGGRTWDSVPGRAPRTGR